MVYLVTNTSYKYMMTENGKTSINDYNMQRYRRRKQKYRILLGIREFIQTPLLNLIWIALLVVALIGNYYLHKYITKLDVPEILIPIYKYVPLVVLITVFAVLVLSILFGVAEVKARNEEADVREAFRDYRVDTMSPILTFKKKLKKNIYIREFYSFIPAEDWGEKKKEIETCLNVQIIGGIETGKNKRKVTLKTFDGNRRTNKEVLYDDEF